MPANLVLLKRIVDDRIYSQIVTGVWVGYDQPKSISNVAEQGYAKKIWTDTMEKGLDGQPKKNLNNQVTS